MFSGIFLWNKTHLSYEIMFIFYNSFYLFRQYAWCICIVGISSNTEIYNQAIKTFYLRCIMKNEHKKWFINFLGWAIAILSCHEFSRLRNACYVILFAISSAILHIYYTLICHSLCILRWESFSFYRQSITTTHSWIELLK